MKLRPEDKNKTEIKQVNYTAFTYVLINAVKEVYREITGVDREIASLKEKAQRDKDLKDQEIALLKARLLKIEQSLGTKKSCR